MATSGITIKGSATYADGTGAGAYAVAAFQYQFSESWLIGRRSSEQDPDTGEYPVCTTTDDGSFSLFIPTANPAELATGIFVVLYDLTLADPHLPASIPNSDHQFYFDPTNAAVAAKSAILRNVTVSAKIALTLTTPIDFSHCQYRRMTVLGQGAAAQLYTAQVGVMLRSIGGGDGFNSSSVAAWYHSGTPLPTLLASQNLASAIAATFSTFNLPTDSLDFKRAATVSGASPAPGPFAARTTLVDFLASLWLPYGLNDQQCFSYVSSAVLAWYVSIASKAILGNPSLIQEMVAQSGEDAIHIRRVLMAKALGPACVYFNFPNGDPQLDRTCEAFFGLLWACGDDVQAVMRLTQAQALAKLIQAYNARVVYRFTPNTPVSESGQIQIDPRDTGDILGNMPIFMARNVVEDDPAFPKQAFMDALMPALGSGNPAEAIYGLATSIFQHQPDLQSAIDLPPTTPPSGPWAELAAAIVSASNLDKTTSTASDAAAVAIGKLKVIFALHPHSADGDLTQAVLGSSGFFVSSSSPTFGTAIGPVLDRRPAEWANLMPSGGSGSPSSLGRAVDVEHRLSQTYPGSSFAAKFVRDYDSSAPIRTGVSPSPVETALHTALSGWAGTPPSNLDTDFRSALLGALPTLSSGETELSSGQIALQTGIRQVASLASLTNKYTEIDSLRYAGLTSALSIAKAHPSAIADALMSHPRMVVMDTENYSVHGAAAKIHADAQVRVGHIFQLHAQLNGLGALPNLTEKTAADYRQMTSDIMAGHTSLPTGVTLDTLFGPQGFCACGTCRSIHGPAAYLVDLLQELKSAGSYSGSQPFDWLTSQRPDIPALLLSCENTNAELPYIDLVNEVLEYNLYATGDDAPVLPNQTGQSAVEIASYPENILEAAYIGLQTLSLCAPFGMPASLPFCLRLEEARVYLKQLGVTYRELVEAHALDGSTDGLFILQLGLSLGQALALSEPAHSAGWWWGGLTIPSDGSSSPVSMPLSEALVRTGRSVEDLTQVAQLHYMEYPVPGAPGVNITWDSGCDPSQAIFAVRAVNSHDALRVFDRIRRLLRLQSALGWSLRDIDAFLWTNSPSETFSSGPMVDGIERASEDGPMWGFDIGLLTQLGHIVDFATSTSTDPVVVACWVAGSFDYESRLPVASGSQAHWHRGDFGGSWYARWIWSRAPASARDALLPDSDGLVAAAQATSLASALGVAPLTFADYCQLVFGARDGSPRLPLSSFSLAAIASLHRAIGLGRILGIDPIELRHLSGLIDGFDLSLTDAGLGRPISSELFADVRGFVQVTKRSGISISDFAAMVDSPTLSAAEASVALADIRRATIAIRTALLLGVPIVPNGGTTAPASFDCAAQLQSLVPGLTAADATLVASIIQRAVEFSTPCAISPAAVTGNLKFIAGTGGGPGSLAYTGVLSQGQIDACQAANSTLSTEDLAVLTTALDALRQLPLTALNDAIGAHLLSSPTLSRLGTLAGLSDASSHDLVLAWLGDAAPTEVLSALYFLNTGVFDLKAQLLGAVQGLSDAVAQLVVDTIYKRHVYSSGFKLATSELLDLPAGCTATVSSTTDDSGLYSYTASYTGNLSQSLIDSWLSLTAYTDPKRTTILSALEALRAAPSQAIDAAIGSQLLVDPYLSRLVEASGATPTDEVSLRQAVLNWFCDAESSAVYARAGFCFATSTSAFQSSLIPLVAQSAPTPPGFNNDEVVNHLWNSGLGSGTPSSVLQLFADFAFADPQSLLGHFDTATRTIHRISAAARICASTGLGKSDVVALLDQNLGDANFNVVQFANLPTGAQEFSGNLSAWAENAVNAATAWRKTLAFASLVSQLPAADGVLGAWMTSSVNVDFDCANLVPQCGWRDEDYRWVFPNISSSGVPRSVDALTRVRAYMTVCSRLGVSAAVANSWVIQELWSTGGEDTAAEANAAAVKAMVAAVRSRNESDWPNMGPKLRAPIRELQRDALVAMRLAQQNAGYTSGSPVFTADSISEDLWIDVEMGAAQMTTRIVQATASIQTFVQRTLLGIQIVQISSSPDVFGHLQLADHFVQDRWPRISAYRVWEADRKVFLYPENWIEPELRQDKSYLFQKFESELVQSDLSQDSIDTAFENYLEGLAEIADLEVLAVHEAIDTSISPVDRAGYVVARTRSTPRKLFYREFRDGSTWTSWLPVNVDIDANQVLPVVFLGRLYLFWPVLNDPKANASAAATSASSAPLATTADPKAPAAAAISSNWASVQVAWSECKRGKWGAKRMSEEIGFPLGADSTSTLMTNVSILGTIFEDGILLLLVEGLPNGNNVFAFNGLRAGEYPAQYPTEDPTRLAFTSDGIAAKPTGAKLVGQYWRPQNLLVDPEHPDVTPSDNSQRYYFLDGGVEQSPGSQSCGIRVGANADVSRYVSSLALRQVQGNSQWADLLGAFPALSAIETNSHALAVVRQQDSELSTPGLVANNWEISYGYELRSMWLPVVDSLRVSLAQSGSKAVLRPANQTSGAISLSFTPVTSSDRVDARRLANGVDFGVGMPNSAYHWEIFFHVPMLIANRLMQDDRFTDAIGWLNTILNPSANVAGGTDSTRFWQTRPLKEYADGTKSVGWFLALLQLDGFMSSDQKKANQIAINEAREAIQAWIANPFDPHAIAMVRVSAYQRAIFMKYLDLLIGWGDSLYRQDTRETVNQASQLYMLASDLLGPRPLQGNPSAASAPSSTLKSFSDLTADPIGDSSVSAIEMYVSTPPARYVMNNGQQGRQPVPKTKAPLPADLYQNSGYFCIPANDKLLGYWDTVGDRLFKIRHSLSLDGVPQQLALFAPPIDPGLLVKAAAAGVSVTDAISGLDSPGAQTHRFSVLLQRANELCADVKALGAMFLGILEKRDAEALALLRSGHEITILSLVEAVKQRQIDEAQQAVEVLNAAMSMTVARQTYYATRPMTIAEEEDHISSIIDAALIQGEAQLVELLAGGLGGAPQTQVGWASWGPFAVVDYGGQQLASPVQSFSKVLNLIASAITTSGTISSLRGGFSRRKDDWDFQAQQATLEIEHMNRQLVGAQIRLAVTNLELSNHQKQLANAQAVDAVMRSKFTNQELYDWMIGQVSTVYRQAYDEALKMARRAEKAHQFETSDANTYIRPGYWDSLKKGLLAGEILQRDLRQLEVASIDLRPREHEMTKHVSLAIFAPSCLKDLRDQGFCDLDIPEEWFDLDLPGHYMRRIKGVSVTIPSVTGPYQGVHCLVTLKPGSSVRLTPTLAGGAYPRSGTDDSRFAQFDSAVQSIVTSTAQNDAGMFDSRDDARYVPFEGAGAISSWRLEFPGVSDGLGGAVGEAITGFDVSSMVDLVLHVRYTARYGGDALRAKAVANLNAQVASTGEPLWSYQLLSLKRDFASLWTEYAAGWDPGSSPSLSVTLPLSLDQFRFPGRGRAIKLSGASGYPVMRRPLTALPEPLFVDLSPAVSANTESVTTNELPVTSTGWQVSVRLESGADPTNLAAGLACLDDILIVLRYRLPS